MNIIHYLFYYDNPSEKLESKTKLMTKIIATRLWNQYLKQPITRAKPKGSIGEKSSVLPPF